MNWVSIPENLFNRFKKVAHNLFFNFHQSQLNTE